MATPLIVTANLASPLIDGGDPIHLDGVLALAWIRRHGRQAGAIDRRSGPADVEDPHLPLVRVSALGTSCWLASAGMLSADESPAAIWQTKRRDNLDWDNLSKPVHVSSGPGKNLLLRRSARVASSIWWLAWGQRREVLASLRLLWGERDAPHGFLGSARRSGAGEIASWSVARGEHELVDCFVDDGGVAMRHLPTTWLKSCARPRIGAYLPPYWLPANRCCVSSVGHPVKLLETVSLAILEAANRI